MRFSAVGETNMNQKKVNISAIVLAKNEQDRIEKCLSALSFCSQIILVDNGSTDNTVQIAKKYNATILVQKNANFAQLRNLAKIKATNDWLLYIDSDEIVTDALADDICTATSDRSTSGPTVYQLRRKNYYLGHEWPMQELMSRLFHSSAHVEWKGSLHETPVAQGACVVLDGLLLHYTHRNLEQMVDKTNVWSSIEAANRYQTNHPLVSWWRFIRVMITAFGHTFVRDGGWRVGTVGWIESVYQAFSMFITYAKLWELQQEKKRK